MVLEEEKPRKENLPMNDPEHLSSLIPRAYQELLAMIEKGKRERERDCQKVVDLQMQFPFTLNTNEQETNLRNLENYYEKTNCTN